MGNPAETVVNGQGVDNNIGEPVSSQGTIECDDDNGPRTTQAGHDTENVDSDGNDKNRSRNRKKKRHRHRSWSNVEAAPVSEHGATSGGHTGDNETGEESSGNENIIVSSSVRKKRSKGSSRHHKHSSKDVVSGEDSGLSMGNSLNESMITGDISRVNPKENEIRNRSEIKSVTVGSNDHQNKDEENQQDIKEKEPTEEKEEREAFIPCSNDSEKSNADEPTTKEGLVIHEHVSNNREQKDKSDSKRTDPMQRRLVRQKTHYRLEKEMLEKRLDEMKTKFEEEIAKYEQDLSDHRQEYLKELSSLQLQEQYESLSVRISDLGQLEDQLDKRFKDCIKQQSDLEEMERFLNMREELCKSKEKDITKLDDELDAWQNELDIKRRQLENADTSRRRTDSSLNSSYSKTTSDEEDYILKKNLLKCQADLSRSEEENTMLHKQLDSMKTQVCKVFTLTGLKSAQIQTCNHEKKIKQLESQLVIALGQLGSQNKNHLNQNSLPPINGHRPSVASSSGENRIEEIQRERRLRHQLGKDHLSINQEAALRRQLSGKDSGISTRSPSSSKISIRTPNSMKEGSFKELGGRSHAVGNAEGSQSGEEGYQHKHSAVSDVGTSPGKSSASISSKTEKSSVCVLM